MWSDLLGEKMVSRSGDQKHTFVFLPKYISGRCFEHHAGGESPGDGEG